MPLFLLPEGIRGGLMAAWHKAGQVSCSLRDVWHCKDEVGLFSTEQLFIP